MVIWWSTRAVLSTLSSYRIDRLRMQPECIDWGVNTYRRVVNSHNHHQNHSKDYLGSSNTKDLEFSAQNSLNRKFTVIFFLKNPERFLLQVQKIYFTFYRRKCYKCPPLFNMFLMMDTIKRQTSKTEHYPINQLLSILQN